VRLTISVVPAAAPDSLFLPVSLTPGSTFQTRSCPDVPVSRGHVPPAARMAFHAVSRFNEGLARLPSSSPRRESCPNLPVERPASGRPWAWPTKHIERTKIIEAKLRSGVSRKGPDPGHQRRASEANGDRQWRHACDLLQALMGASVFSPPTRLAFTGSFEATPFRGDGVDPSSQPWLAGQDPFVE